MNKISIVTNSLVLGGSEKMVMHTAKSLGFSVILLENDREFDVADVEISRLSKLNRQQSSFLLWVGAVISSRRLAKKLESSESVLVYLERALICTVCSLLFLKERPRIIVNVESDLAYKYGKYGSIGKRVLSTLYCFADDIVFKTIENSKSFTRFLPEVNARKHVINNPILTGVNESRLDVNYRIEGYKNILIAGRLHLTKGIWFSICLFSALIKKGGQFKLFIAGDGPEKQALMSHSIKLGLRIYVGDSLPEYAKDIDVFFLGAVDGMGAIYCQSDLLLANSYSESFGLTVVESIICGTPVVASKFGGVLDEITSHYINVVDVTPQNSDEIKHIERWLEAIEYSSSVVVSDEYKELLEARFSNDKYLYSVRKLLNC
ncbi:MAG: glycosyltransferase [Colwellia sp.]